MTESEHAVISGAFSSHPRPAVFTDVEHCTECVEHNRTLAALYPETMAVEDLGHPGWDPISFATPETFLYFFPSLARLAMQGRGETFYLDRFLFHLAIRVDLFSPTEHGIIYEYLWRLLEHFHGDQHLSDLVLHQFDDCLRGIEQRLQHSSP